MNGATGIPTTPTWSASSGAPPAATQEPQPLARIKMKPLEEEALYAYRRGDKPSRRAVMFVHGFTGSWDETWRSNTTTFFDLIAQDPELKDFDIYAFSYRTQFHGGASIDENAVRLEKIIERHLTPEQELVLIAHSMGGLLSMRYILNRLGQGQSVPVIGLLLYGVPMTGTDWVKILDMATAVVDTFLPRWVGSIISYFRDNHRQLTALKTGSDFLQELHGEWALRVVNGGHSEVETDPRRRRWLPVRVVTGDKDIVVSQISAQGVYGKIDWEPLRDRSHTALVKPTSNLDSVYTTGCDFLKKCRLTKDPDTLAQLRGMSDAIWRQRESRLIQNWLFNLELFEPTAVLDACLRAAGYEACRIAPCRYEAILRTDEFRLAIAFGKSTSESLWKAAITPDYVYTVFGEKLSNEEYQRVKTGFDQVLRTCTEQEAFKVFFPKLELTMNSREPAKSYQGNLERVEKDVNSLLAVFRFVDVPTTLLGEEVVLELRFTSIIPSSAISYQVLFFLTRGCTIRANVYGKVDFLTVASHAATGTQFQIDAKESEIFIKSDHLIPAHTRFDILWQRSDNEATGNATSG